MKKLILLIVLAVLVAGCIEKPPEKTLFYQKEFAGVKLNFRANLSEAEKVPVLPNETALRQVLLNIDVEEVGIAYIPNESENSFYLASSFELAYKLSIIYKYYFGRVKIIDSIPVNSSLEALSMSSYKKPIIMLIGPANANSTLVNVVGPFITVQGRNFEQIDRNYNDLDLATDKLLLVLMKEVNI